MQPAEHCLQHFLQSSLCNSYICTLEKAECGWEIHRRSRCLPALGTDLNADEVQFSHI